MHRFAPLRNDILIKAAFGKNESSRIPVWMMRQAGRHMEEFKKLREKHDFFTVCRTPELACEVTLQPINRYDVDAAIIFSDILVIPQALGLGVEMVPGKGPSFTSKFTSFDDVLALSKPSVIPEQLDYVYKAITLTRTKLNGFAGAPWTLMSYIIEGGGSTTQSQAKKWLYTEAENSHQLLSILTESVILHLVEQVFESHAGVLSRSIFSKFALPCLKNIADGVRDELKIRNISQVPLIIFAKDGQHLLEDLATLDYDVISLDWLTDIQLARNKCRNKSLQGNLDPCALYSKPDEVKDLVREMVSKFDRKSYICNLGHGVYPDINPVHVEAFVEAVHSC